jgi:hypothetical protein
MPLSNLTPGGSMLVRKSYAEGSMLVRTDRIDSIPQAIHHHDRSHHRDRHHGPENVRDHQLPP